MNTWTEEEETMLSLAEASQQPPLIQLLFGSKCGAVRGSKKYGDLLIYTMCAQGDLNNTFQLGASHIHPATCGTWWEQDTWQVNCLVTGGSSAVLLIFFSPLSSKLVTNLCDYRDYCVAFCSVKEWAHWFWKSLSTLMILLFYAIIL